MLLIEVEVFIFILQLNSNTRLLIIKITGASIYTVFYYKKAKLFD